MKPLPQYERKYLCKDLLELYDTAELWFRGTRHIFIHTQIRQCAEWGLSSCSPPEKKKKKKSPPMLDHSAVTGRPTTTCSAPSYADVWEEPLCLTPWPLADLPLPADRPLNTASPPVEMSEEQTPLQSHAVSDWTVITMATWLISSPLKD